MYRIDRYLNESTYDGRQSGLEFEHTRLELTVKQNQALLGEIRIASKALEPVHCVFCCNHYRMQCLTEEFTAREGVLKYKFDAYGLEPGDVAQGEITVISNVGEYPIPFRIEVDQPSLENASLGSLRNLFHFANLARSNFQEAVRVFYEDDFGKLFKGHDRQYYSLYRGLSGVKGNEHNVDQFLIAIHKKNANSYEVIEQALLLSEEDIVHENYITIRRNGWGYTHVTVELQGGFLTSDKSVLTHEDFVEDICEYRFSVDTQKLKGGDNTGCFVLHFSDDEVRCPVAIHMPQVVKKYLRQKREYNEKLSKLMQLYMEYVTSDEKPKECLVQIEKLIDQMNNQGGKNIRARLMQTHVLLEMARENEARWILSHVEQMIENDETEPGEYAYFLYLTAKLSHEESTTQQMAARIRRIINEAPMDFWPICFYLDLLQSAKASPVKKLAVYEEYYYKGANSPVLYRGAWSVLEDGMAYLTKLGEFEIAVLRFAMKYALFTEDAARQVNHLAKRRHDMSRSLYYLLKRSYELFEDDETLSVLCSLMIRMGLTDADAYSWYDLAIQKELRITNLYEYYLMSLDPKTRVLPPQMVLMYFAYDCHLNDARKAFLYRLVLEYRAQIRQLFEQYEPKIVQFAWSQIEKDNISEDLAVLYKYLFNDDKNLEKAKDHLLKIGFCHRILSKRKMKKVILIQDKLQKESRIPIEQDTAYVHCVAGDYVILLEDEQQNRYADPELYEDNKLMASEKIAMRMKKAGEDSVEFLLYCMEIGGDTELSDKKSWPVYERLSMDSEVEAAYRQKLFTKLLQNYYENDRTEEVVALLKDFSFETADRQLRSDIVRYLIGCGQDKRAYEVLYDYGFEGVAPKALTRLIGPDAQETIDKGCDSRLLALTYYTFLEGKYTPEMLRYLCRYFWGSLRQMRDIFVAAVKFDIDASELSERILQVALFSGGFVPQLEEVFLYYAKQSRQRRESMIRMYIQRMSYNYFVLQDLGQQAVFETIEEYLRSDEHVEEICRLAYLKYMSAKAKSCNELQKKIVEKLVSEFINEKYYVPFMEPFSVFIPWLKVYKNWTYLEYHTKPGARVTLHYISGREDGEYVKEQLAEFGGGYFCWKYMLLFGESIQYYFEEQVGTQEQLTESGSLEKSDIMEDDGASRFSMLNDMVMSRSLGDSITEQALIDEYMRKSLLVELLFGGSGK